jgi:hypothetical protein
MVALGKNEGLGFLLDPKSTTSHPRLHTTSLHPHRFNGGYDPASPLTWTPKAAAEFTIFHESPSTPEFIGMQLRTAIQHWSGTDLAEFLTRLYLGERAEPVAYPKIADPSPWSMGQESKIQLPQQNKLVYEPENVRAPRWKGLKTREGILALKVLLKEAVSMDTLEAKEVARFAEAFLLKEYKWPTRREDKEGEIVFEQDSFYTQGHAKTLARLFWSIRKEKASAYDHNDFVAMVTLPEKEKKETAALQLEEFFQTLMAQASLTEEDKATMVQRLAIGGWSPSAIPKFTVLAGLSSKATKNSTALEIAVADDSFLDFPSAHDAQKKTDGKKVTKDVVEEIIEKLGDNSTDLVLSEEQVLLSSQLRRARATISLEYDKLVNSYWKQVEIPNQKKRPNASSDKTKEPTQSEESVGARM